MTRAASYKKPLAELVDEGLVIVDKPLEVRVTFGETRLRRFGVFEGHLDQLGGVGKTCFFMGSGLIENEDGEIEVEEADDYGIPDLIEWIEVTEF